MAEVQQTNINAYRAEFTQTKDELEQAKSRHENARIALFEVSEGKEGKPENDKPEKKSKAEKKANEDAVKKKARENFDEQSSNFDKKKVSK